MSADYAIEIYAPNGTHLKQVLNSTRIEYVQRVNAVGMFSLELPADNVLMPVWAELAGDARVVIWRQPVGAARFSVDFSGLCRYSELFQRQQRLYLRLSGYSINEILARSIVHAPASTDETPVTESLKTGACDDVMKAIVREQLGALAGTSIYPDADRDRSAQGFTVAPDLALGTTVTKAFSRRNVLTVLQELAQDSLKVPDTAVWFGFVPVGDGLQGVFTTNVGQWGIDARGSVTFSLENGNASNMRDTMDRRGELTYVYGGGSGVGTARIEPAPLYSLRQFDSPLNRREGFYSLNSETDTAAIQGGMRGVLNDARPVRRLLFDVIDTNKTRLGVHYSLGARVLGEFAGVTREYHVAGYQVVHVAGKDDLTVNLEEFPTANEETYTT